MQSKTGLLLINLGTPDSPSEADVKKYLIEFLTDPRVIELPWLKRQLLVRRIIVPRRFKESAKQYQAIWEKEGSPLLKYGKSLCMKLQQHLGSEYCVELGMRYGSPSIQQALLRLEQQNLSELIIVPLFPQYASATTGSAFEVCHELLKTWRTQPQMRWISSYCEYEPFINAVAKAAPDVTKYDKVIISFHGLPQKAVLKSDRLNHCLKEKNCCQKLNEKNMHCYSAQCNATARALAKRLGLERDEWELCFQSRLGKDPWLQPYTSDVLEKCASTGKKRILVFCPAFVADCLETLFEIGVEYRRQWQKLGGVSLDMVPCVNDSDDWVFALSELIGSQEKVLR